MSADNYTMLSPSRRLGEFLVDRKVLSRDTLEVMLDREEKEGTPLPRLLASESLVSEKDLMAAVAHQVGMPFVDLEETSIDPSVDRLIPAELARASVAVAIEPRGSELLVAMADPGDNASILTIEEATGWKVLPAIAERQELRRLLDAMYGRVTST